MRQVIAIERDADLAGAASTRSDALGRRRAHLAAVPAALCSIAAGRRRGRRARARAAGPQLAVAADRTRRGGRPRRPRPRAGAAARLWSREHRARGRGLRGHGQARRRDLRGSTAQGAGRKGRQGPAAQVRPRDRDRHLEGEAVRQGRRRVWLRQDGDGRLGDREQPGLPLRRRPVRDDQDGAAGLRARPVRVRRGDPRQGHRGRRGLPGQADLRLAQGHLLPGRRPHGHLHGLRTRLALGRVRRRTGKVHIEINN